MLNVLFAASDARWPHYEAPLRDAFAKRGLDVNLARNHAPEDVDYIVYAPNSDVQDFTPYTRLRAVLNLWAGVEMVAGNQTLKVPLCRMVDPALTQGMAEWVTGHVLRHHLGIDAHITAEPGTWAPKAPPMSWDRPVTILGLGELGTACAQMLRGIGFPVTGWSRTQKDLSGVTCHAGDAGLTAALKDAQILVLLLPDTTATTNILNEETLAQLPQGAIILNPGRGPLIDDDALLAALDSGQIGHATLDTFRVEPLPKDHPYWHHPNVTVTPHIASETRAAYSSQTIAENIARDQAGQPLLHQVNRTLGY
ncbi:MAG: glyoxylate/hydroxypyruvate reductase A [Pseudomonadota bacterium]